MNLIESLLYYHEFSSPKQRNLNEVDLAVVTETWFTEASESAFNISDFKTFSISRHEKNGGGVAIFVKKHIVTNHANQRCCYECLWLKFKITRNTPKRSSMNLYVGAIYYPPSSPYQNKIIENNCHTVENIRASDYHYDHGRL